MPPSDVLPDLIRRRGRTAAAAGLAALLAVTLPACAQQDPAAPAAPAAPSTPGSAAPTASASASALAQMTPGARPTTTPGTSGTSTAGATGQEPPTSASAVVAAAESYLRVRAEGDVDAAWAALSLFSQQSWGDRELHDAAVRDGAPTYAALLAAGPVLVETDLGEGNGGVVAAVGVVDPDGAARVVSAAVVVGSDAGVQQGPDDDQPSLTWTNPESAQDGTSGLARLDESSPLAVEVGQGAGVGVLSVDGVALPLDGPTLGAASAALPDLAPGRHVVTVAYGYPGEITLAQVAVVDTGTPTS